MLGSCSRIGLLSGFKILLYCALFATGSTLKDKTCDVDRHVRAKFEVNLSDSDDFSVSRCSNVRLLEATGSDGYFIQSKNQRPWPQDGFCQAVNHINVLGYTEYEVSVQLWNQIGNGQVNFGHPGLLFNARDSSNYDFVYFRPHSTSGCYQVGYVKAGNIKTTTSAACYNGPPVGRSWFNVTVRVKDAHASVYMNDVLVTQFQPQFGPGGHTGIIVANGYTNTVHFKNLMANVPMDGEISQPRCEILSTKVGDFSISGCESQDPLEDGDHFVLHTSKGGSWPTAGFCRSITRLAYRGFNHYTVSALLNNQIGNNHIGFGHPGLLFNAKDSRNFDLIYFRPHSAASCYQAGHVTGGTFAGTVSAKCPVGPPLGRSWFHIQIYVQGDKAAVYMDGFFVVEMTTKYSPGGHVGILTANGYDNIIWFKDLLVQVPSH